MNAETCDLVPLQLENLFFEVVYSFHCVFACIFRTYVVNIRGFVESDDTLWSKPTQVQSVRTSFSQHNTDTNYNLEEVLREISTSMIYTLQNYFL